jgi:hypothetical protein
MNIEAPMPLLNTCNVVIIIIKTAEKNGRRSILHRARIFKAVA